MNLDAVKKRYGKKDARTTKPDPSQSIWQEILVAQRAVILATILAYRAAITVRYNKIVKEIARDKKLKRKAGKIKARIINI